MRWFFGRSEETYEYLGKSGSQQARGLLRHLGLNSRPGVWKGDPREPENFLDLVPQLRGFARINSSASCRGAFLS